MADGRVHIPCAGIGSEIIAALFEGMHVTALDISPGMYQECVQRVHSVVQLLQHRKDLAVQVSKSVSIVPIACSMS